MSDMMNNFGLFWNSTNGDRKYNAESFEEWLKKFFTSGVFANECEVTASSGMTVVGTTGYANVDGKVRFFRTKEEFTLSPANSRYPRIDTIVIERSNTNREITRKIVTGAYSGDTPVPTPPVRSETVYQLVTAQIYVGAGVTSITQANITDTRADNSICGYVTGTVTEIDWSQITAQFEEYMQEFRDETETEFYDLLQQMHDLIDQETAGHLQEEINHLNNDISIILGDFATVEPAVTASKAYDVGDYLVLNKMFYKVVAAIAQGDTLVVDGNIETTNVGAEVASLNKDLANIKEIATATGATFGAKAASLYQAWSNLSQSDKLRSMLRVGSECYQLTSLSNALYTYNSLFSANSSQDLTVAISLKDGKAYQRQGTTYTDISNIATIAAMNLCVV